MKGVRPPNAHGGKRSNAGRKIKPENVLKQMQVDARITKAEEAFEFVYQLMNDTSVAGGIRLAAAQDIQDRVFGKPKQAVEHSGVLKLEDVLDKTWA